jgi:NTE family protein
VIVQINPIERAGTPRTAPDILARVNEITFNASLLSELRAIDFVGRLVEESRLPAPRYRKMLVHNLSEGQPLAPLGIGVDLNTDLAFFEELFATGRSAAARWLDMHYEALGERSTVDLAAMFRAAPVVGEAQPLR